MSHTPEENNPIKDTQKQVVDELKNIGVAVAPIAVMTIGILGAFILNEMDKGKKG